MLCMSDLQIVTGLSILISGYVTLGAGLSIYHWQVIVYLAYFSTLTHMGCLTFLRSYLYHHPGQRIWRVWSMVVTAIMLVVAIVPTGSFVWTDKHKTPTVGSQAKCYFRNRFYDSQNMDFWSMLTSVFLISVSFATRVCRAYEFISEGIVKTIRTKLSGTLRSGLRKIYVWCDVANHPRGLKRTIIYHPLLAAFISIRTIADLYSSAFIEVRNVGLLLHRVFLHHRIVY